jgi:hypothetical protein
MDASLPITIASDNRFAPIFTESRWIAPSSVNALVNASHACARYWPSFDRRTIVVLPRSARHSSGKRHAHRAAIRLGTCRATQTRGNAAMRPSAARQIGKLFRARSLTAWIRVRRDFPDVRFTAWGKSYIRKSAACSAGARQTCKVAILGTLSAYETEPYWSPSLPEQV